MNSSLRLIPRWFAGMIVASLAIILYGLGQPAKDVAMTTDSSVTPQNKELYDVLWMDQYPEVQHDKWKAYIFTGDNIGINIDALSAFKLTLEVFEFKADRAKISFHFPHDARRSSCAYKIEKLKKPTKHFDTQLTIENDPQNAGVTKVYFTGPEFRSAATLPTDVRNNLENANLLHYLP